MIEKADEDRKSLEIARALEPGDASYVVNAEGLRTGTKARQRHGML